MTLTMWAVMMQHNMNNLLAQHGMQAQTLITVGYAHLPPGMFLAMQQNLAALATGQVPAPPPLPFVNNGMVPPGLGGVWALAAINPPAVPVLGQNIQQQVHNHHLWFEDHHEGSWPQVIDSISPGAILEEYRARPDYEDPPQRRTTQLLSIAFKSCGYVQLNMPAFDQSSIMAQDNTPKTPYFVGKAAFMKASMMSTDDKFLGRIVQDMSYRQQLALSLAWGLQMGWDEPNAAEDAAFDGFLPGGSGRFSGTVESAHGTELGNP